MRLSIPSELNDICAAIVNIPRGSSEGKLAITLGDAATPGAHRLAVNAIARLGGQELPSTQEILLTVELAVFPRQFDACDQTLYDLDLFLTVIKAPAHAGGISSNKNA